MGKRVQGLIRDEDKLRIHVLWDRVTDLGAPNLDEALRLFLNELTQLLDANYTWWMGALKVADVAQSDPVFGWRPSAVYNLHPSPEREYVKQEHCKRIESGAIDQSVIANLQHVGEFRINIMHEMMPKSWFSGDYYNALYKPFELRDVIYVVTPISESVESWMAFERNGFDKPFYGDYEKELLDYAVRPMKWFHRQLVLRHGVHLVDEPLNDSERRVVNGLLTDKTEQEIADELSLSPATVHTYCTRIYRKFGVRGRAGMTALWLGKMLEE